MKYSSNMKECHSDILKALRVMCENDGNLVEMVPPDSSPLAPLISYFKRIYAHKGHSNGKLAYSCKPTKGVEINFKRAIDKSGDTTIEMTWLQVAKFIRDNRDEFFEETRPKTKALEVLVKTFDEKAITCPNWERGTTLTYREFVNGVSFKCKAFSSEFRKLDDITNFFAHYCNCPENCPHYKKSVAENQPSYIDKLREKYPKVSIEDKWIYENHCPGDLFSGNKIPDWDDDQCALNTEEAKGCQKCWNSSCKADVTFCETADKKFETEYYSHYPAEEHAKDIETPKNEDEPPKKMSKMCQELFASNADTDTKTADLPNPPAPAEETTAVFDYSELDGDTAQNLRECENVIRQKTAGYFTLLGEKFKEAQTLLANHSSGTFEKWYTALGFKRQTVYNLIQRYDFLSSPTLEGREDTFEALPLTLSYEVSKPDAPKELVEKVIDGDITTNAEYIKLKKELEATLERSKAAQGEYEDLYDRHAKEVGLRSELEQRISELENRPLEAEIKKYKQQLNEANRRTEEAEMQARTYQHNYFQANKNFDMMCEDNVKLEERIKELEARPIEVAVQQDESVLKELEQLREENARLKDTNIKKMIIRLTMDDYHILVNALGREPRLQNIVKHAEILKL